VNVSSPNTPGLRDLQQRDRLTKRLRALRAEVDALPQPRPPLVSDAPTWTRPAPKRARN
jgi:dihydroorotate dehydrogenase